MRRVIILAIGNELLIGETLDTNTNWLCRHLTGLGAQVERAAILPDKIDAIAEEIKRACRDQIDLLITTGGLGPTDDDLTLAALAQALALPLQQDPIAYDMLAEKYRQLAAQGYVDSAEMNPARVKMANLPMGARPLINPVGAAPAVEIIDQVTTIICLPGVPAELQGIVKQSLSDRFTEIFGVGSFQERDIWVACGDESTLAPLLREIVNSHPNVYIKSKAKSFGAQQRFNIKLHARGEVEQVSAWLKQAEDALRVALTRAGIDLLPSN
jgi:molybdenum cofactor synthesis domain-containing protein